MPLFDFECVTCGESWEAVGNLSACGRCGSWGKKLPPLVSIVSSGNMGRKLKNRVALDTELKKMGLPGPLFKSEEAKDKARWLMKKASVPWR